MFNYFSISYCNKYLFYKDYELNCGLMWNKGKCESVRRYNNFSVKHTTFPLSISIYYVFNDIEFFIYLNTIINLIE